MKAKGIEKASLRLRQASRHLDTLATMANSLDVPAFEYEWFQAISAINSAHEILRTTAWKDATSKQWFASIDKNVIRKDPLLRFILHARGADHHGITSGTTPHVEGAEYLGHVEKTPFSVQITASDGSTQNLTGGAAMLAGDVASFSFSHQLTAVTDDRDGTVYDPPTSHLGDPLSATDPVNVARLAVAYYSGMTSTASSKFITP